MDRGAWQAVVHGVTKSQTWLKRLSTSIIRLIKVHSSHRFSLYCTFYGFDKCMMSCIHPYNILHNSFIALNIPCAPSVHLSPALGNCWFFFFFFTVSIVCFFSHRASLVVQWLIIHLVTQWTLFQSLVWEDPTCRGATKPSSYNYWAHTQQLLKPEYPRTCAPQQEKSQQWEACTSHLESTPTLCN